MTELVGGPVVHLAFGASSGQRSAGSSRVVGVWTRLWRRTLEGVGLVRAVKLAADLGYTDQAHLAHDFKNVTGKSPSAFGRDVGR